jgi:O-antigen ligase
MLNIFKANEDGDKISAVAFLSFTYFLFMPLSIVPLPGGISILKVISIFVGGLLILSLFIGKNELKLNFVHLMLSLYVIYSIGSLFLLRDLNAWENLRGILETTLLFLLITSRIYNKREKSFLLNAWVIVGVIAVLLMLTGAVEMANGAGRVTLGIGGANEDPNQLCGYFFLPILVCIERLTYKNKKAIEKIFYVILILAMIYVVFITGSRGGLIAVVASILTFSFFAIRGIMNKIKVFVSLILISAVFVIALYPLLPSSVTERFTVQSVQEDKGSGRLDIWLVIWRAITYNDNSLLYGYGLGSTTGFLISSGSHSTVAHNHWLQIWCDQGFIGVFLFFMTMVAGFGRTYKFNKIVALSLFGMFVLSQSLTLYAAYKPFWNVLMMSAINYRGEDYIEN